MTCTDNQIKLLRKEKMKNNAKVSAAKSGMDVKTARKYLKSGKLPSQMKVKHDWKTKSDPFEADWLWIKPMILKDKDLQATSLMEDLVAQHPDRYQMNQLRTLQRRFDQTRAEAGPNTDVKFMQRYDPGRQSQVDFTRMKKLEVTINGKVFDHMLFHFKLSCSKWEWVKVCFTENFENLAEGVEDAFFRLGKRTKEIRTDNLSPAWTSVGKGQFKLTKDWKNFTNHYDIKPTRNNPGESHENGVVEKSHDLFKNHVNQKLILRGSRDFSSQEEYEGFLLNILNKRNKGVEKALAKEADHLKDLPTDKWLAPKVTTAKVRSTCIVEINKVQYSVPSRLIGRTLIVYTYRDKIDLYYKHTFVQTMAKLDKGANIDYRHIVHSLIKKPGAFHHYIYKSFLYPCAIFKRAYESCEKASPVNGHKVYIRVLDLSKNYGEENVREILEKLLENKSTIDTASIRSLLKVDLTTPDVRVDQPNLSQYDVLTSMEVA